MSYLDNDHMYVESAGGKNLLMTVSYTWARGGIVDIVLHPDELPIGDEPVVELNYLPLCSLVKPHRTRATRLEGL